MDNMQSKKMQVNGCRGLVIEKRVVRYILWYRVSRKEEAFIVSWQVHFQGCFATVSLFPCVDNLEHKISKSEVYTRRGGTDDIWMSDRLEHLALP
jgi:hypothetical protein